MLKHIRLKIKSSKNKIFLLTSLFLIFQPLSNVYSINQIVASQAFRLIMAALPEIGMQLGEIAPVYWKRFFKHDDFDDLNKKLMIQNLQNKKKALIITKEDVIKNFGFYPQMLEVLEKISKESKDQKLATNISIVHEDVSSTQKKENLVAEKVPSIAPPVTNMKRETYVLRNGNSSKESELFFDSTSANIQNCQQAQNKSQHSESSAFVPTIKYSFTHENISIDNSSYFKSQDYINDQHTSKMHQLPAYRDGYMQHEIGAFGCILLDSNSQDFEARILARLMLTKEDHPTHGPASKTINRALSHILKFYFDEKTGNLKSLDKITGLNVDDKYGIDKEISIALNNILDSEHLQYFLTVYTPNHELLSVLQKIDKNAKENFFNSVNINEELITKVRNSSFNKKLWNIYEFIEAGRFDLADKIVKQLQYQDQHRLAPRFYNHLVNKKLKFNSKGIPGISINDPFIKNMPQKNLNLLRTTSPSELYSFLYQRHLYKEKIKELFQAQSNLSEVEEVIYKFIDSLNQTEEQFNLFFDIAKNRETKSEVFNAFFRPNGILKSYGDSELIKNFSINPQYSKDEQCNLIFLANKILSLDYSSDQQKAFRYLTYAAKNPILKESKNFLFTAESIYKALEGNTKFNDFLGKKDFLDVQYNPTNQAEMRNLISKFIPAEIAEITNVEIAKKLPVNVHHQQDENESDDIPAAEIIGTAIAISPMPSPNMDYDPNDPEDKKHEDWQKAKEDIVKAIEKFNNSSFAKKYNLKIDLEAAFHVEHGNIRNGKPTGSHFIKERHCCFENQIEKDYGPNLEKIIRTFYKGVPRNPSSFFPKSWDLPKVLEKIAEWGEKNQPKFLSKNDHVTKYFVESKCCNRRIEFSVNNNSGIIESIYPSINALNALNINQLNCANCIGK